MAYHIRPDGTPGPCRARNRPCPLGAAQEHYDSEIEARRAYEAAMGSAFSVPVSEQDRDRMRGDARALAASFLDDPDWLPPIDDPEKVDALDEEEGYIDSLDPLRDPALARGNCLLVAEAVQAYTRDELPVIEVEVGGPHLNVHAANLTRDREGREWVFDYTYSQIDPQAAWPHVAPKDEWIEAVKRAGWTSPDELDATYLQVEDESYKMTHQPDEDGAQAHSIESHFPDYYAHPEWYGTGNAVADGETLDVLRRIRANPDAEVTIYRSLPDHAYGIRRGNWVTLSKSYAEDHGAEAGEGGTDWPVVSMRVRARDVRSPGDSINEWGYYPEA